LPYVYVEHGQSWPALRVGTGHGFDAELAMLVCTASGSLVREPSQTKILQAWCTVGALEERKRHRT
jgi:hypothetical protein